MQEYELTVLIHPDLEADLEKPLTKIRELITTNGGKIIKEDNWGKKKLAYVIRKENFAIYVAMDLELPPEAPLKISNTLNITDEALRYLLVKTDAKERARLEAAKQNQGSDNNEEEHGYGKKY